MQKKALGRGLGAILGPLPGEEVLGRIEESPGGVRTVEVGSIYPNPYQPRQDFDPAGLAELAESMRDRGMLQPVVVRPAGIDRYELIAGERRWRAARLAGLAQIQAVVRDADEGEMLELALVENLQRRDLNPIETAQACARMMEEFGRTQEEVGVRLGQSRASVANLLRLLHLPAEVREALRDGRLTPGHAKAILGLPREEGRIALSRRVIAEGLSVRRTEQLAGARGKNGIQGKYIQNKDIDLEAMEGRLRKRLGTRVRLHARGRRGRIVIEYYSGEELERLVDLLLGRTGHHGG